ncbi:MAG: hypothetical protein EHM47_17280 [Ignavibacteriales bacterium]|nr:MAG: hypothetical protein EHM47_17280 [Ignavibacteriales bacterium]
MNKQKVKNMNKDVISLYSGLAFDEAVSHLMHSGIFEILGYLSMIERKELSEEDQVNLYRAEELCKSVISELHIIIDNYKDKDSG